MRGIVVSYYPKPSCIKLSPNEMLTRLESLDEHTQMSMYDVSESVHLILTKEV